MSYAEKLKLTSENNDSIVCMGMDAVIEKMPLEIEDTEEKIFTFYKRILDATKDEVGAVKPNIGFYAQYGFKGLRALKKLIEHSHLLKLPVILDAKRADIGKTSAAYAKSIFDFWNVDCVTFQPYMGHDSVSPILKYCEKEGKGVYLLNRTSNQGAVDFQNLDVDGKPFYLKVSEKIIEWGKSCRGNLGAVVGATSMQEFEDIMGFYLNNAGKVPPLLIPGVGAQGGSASEVVSILRKLNIPLRTHRINSSSGINYAWQKQGTDDYAEAALRAVRSLNREIAL